MEATPSPRPTKPDLYEEVIGLAIRHAVFLTGGLILLALGVSSLSGSLGQVLECAAQTSFCPHGSDNAYYFQLVPVLVGSVVLLVVAFVLIMMSRRLKPRSG